MMAVVHPLSRSFSPAVGGSQNVARVSSTITVEQRGKKQSQRSHIKRRIRDIFKIIGNGVFLRITWPYT
jgi:RNase P protein component